MFLERTGDPRIRNRDDGTSGTSSGRTDEKNLSFFSPSAFSSLAEKQQIATKVNKPLAFSKLRNNYNGKVSFTFLLAYLLPSFSSSFSSWISSRLRDLKWTNHCRYLILPTMTKMTSRPSSFSSLIPFVSSFSLPFSRPLKTQKQVYK